MLYWSLAALNHKGVAIRFTGERWEAYSALLFLRARYYEPGTGRFVSKDPWSGDVQQPATCHGWVYAQNDPIDYTDPAGLKVRKFLIPQQYVYSCRCGWIDWGHAGPGAAYNLIDKVLTEPSAGTPRTLMHIEMQSWFGLKRAESDYVINEAWDNVPFAWPVALRAFKELSEDFEAVQGGASGYSEEDLPSNLIGFYIAMYEHWGMFNNPDDRLSFAEKVFICNECGCVDRVDDTSGKNSRKVYDAYKENDAWQQVTDWNAAHVDFDDGCVIPPLCGGTKRTWPERFGIFSPVPQGRLCGFLWEYVESIDGPRGPEIRDNVWEIGSYE